MLDILEGFNGSMDLESVQATVYSYWQYFFYQNLMSEFTNEGLSGSQLQSADGQVFWNLKRKLQLVDNIGFSNFYHRKIVDLASGKPNKLFNEDDVAKAFIEAKEFLTKNFGSQGSWKYKNVHVNDYPSQPWSMTKLKYFYHREVPTGGNGNTINLSRYSMGDILENKKLKSTHVSNYKQVIEFAQNPKDDVNLMSIDTGMGGNYFAGHYFTMNANHLSGKLQPIETSFKKLMQ